MLAKFKEFVNLAETGMKVKQLNLVNQTVKNLRPDKGGDYVSNNFEKFCNNRGIQHEPTFPHSQQQNGIAKYMNRTLLETARPMLHHAHKLLKFWAEAVSTACYV